ncbi:MAG: NAD(P)/FAD-dependent oxidoreductase [Bacteroidia bacterium]|nr:NAD(P)/FAD-dependent oxidoreductase [Bacteroidia bacterium]MDW8416866.1 FAD/NAD(P)-binding oxidoreductase [Bacteroidia bacterium]
MSKSQNHFQVLIVGGGNAGLSVMNYLLRKRSDLQIGLIEPSETHYYQPAWTLVGGGAYKLENTIRREQDYIPKEVTWIKDRVVSFEPEQNAVLTEGGKRVTYDFMVVAPGIQLDWHKIKGATEWLGKNGVCSIYTPQTAVYTHQVIESLTGKGKAVFTAPGTPVKCGGAPMKIMFLTADNLRRRGLLKPGIVYYYSAGTVIFAVKKYAETLIKVADRYHIQRNFKHELVEIDGQNKVAYFEDRNGSEPTRVAVEFEMLHVVPPQSAPDFIKRSPLAVPDNPLGWIDVNKHTLQHNRYPNIFALGDASSLPTSKTGAAIRKQTTPLVENLLYCIDNRTTDLKQPKEYNGYSACPIITGYGKLVLAEFDYNLTPQESFPFDQSKERYSMWLLKREVLPRMYWWAILKGRMQG